MLFGSLWFARCHLFEGGAKPIVYHSKHAIQVVNGVACVCMVCSCGVGAYGCVDGLVHGASCFDWTAYALCQLNGLSLFSKFREAAHKEEDAVVAQEDQ